MTSRTGILVFALAATIAAGCAPVRSQGAGGDLKTFTRGTVSTTAVEWPDIVARKKGFYANEGLKMEQALISPTTITPSLIGGSIQFGFINASQLVIADKAGADLVAIGQGADPSPYSLMAAKSIKSLSDLRGKTISLAEQGDVYAEATKEILRKSGLDPDQDVNLRYGGNSNQRMAALMAGAVDAVPVVPPQDRILLDQGYNAIAFYPDYFPKLALSLTAVTRSFAKANPDIVRAFMRAQAAAIAWLYNPANKDEAMKLLMEETRADLPAASQAYDIYLVKLRIFPPNGCIQTPGIDALIHVLSSVNKSIKDGEPASQFVDTQYCSGQ